jgi:26S proteasome regulatory subunit T2
MLKMERIKDYLLMEEEFVANQANQQGEDRTAADRSRVDELRGSPMGVDSLEEIIDDDHAIVSVGNGPEYYVGIMSFVDKDMLEPGCSVLLHHKTHAIVGVLADDTNPMVSVMKLDKAPTELRGCRRPRHPDSGDQGVGGAAVDASGALRRDGHPTA